MTGVLRPSKQRSGMKRPRNEPYRVFDNQHVPTVPCDFASFRRMCSSPSSSSAALRQSREKPQSRHKSRSRGIQLRMEELMCIKKELTVIKSQIDELLDSLERMDPQSQELAGKTLLLSSSDAPCKGDGVAFSPLHGSVNSADDSSGSPPPLRTDRDTQSPQTADSSDEDRQHVNYYESDMLYM
ncbi:RNA-binding Raly-like protein isoform X2 [Sinocyclocheilus grahami]|uniref:RNA-binding Raly-like protein isoform X2 n=1 Tax=Sinocyclocheilus grahami TaxID=75366 RepID=UPI0007ACFA4C|nr:PREDICTED: RNA-binding Raly-like protein isoform X2 [Sinocyclocheilus grahami]